MNTVRKEQKQINKKTSSIVAILIICFFATVISGGCSSGTSGSKTEYKADNSLTTGNTNMSGNVLKTEKSEEKSDVPTDSKTDSDDGVPAESETDSDDSVPAAEEAQESGEIISEKSSEIIISEVMSSNSKYAPVNGQCYDFVEITNVSDHTVNLSSYYLSDKKSKPMKYRLPDAVLETGAFYVIYCSGLDEEGHAPFKISKDGESLYLSDGENIRDMLDVPADIEKDKSYGRVGDRLVYMDIPSPGEENNDGVDSRVPVPSPSFMPGQYKSSISVSLNGEGTIYYTLDGSRPTEKSKIYSEPIKIDSVITIRTFSLSDRGESEIGEYTYFVGTDHTLPIVYVSIPQNCLTGADGVLDNINKDIEKEAVISLYEDGEVKFAAPCGFRLHGNDSRKGAKQNFQIRFRSKYGLSRLHYKLFDDLSIDSFNSLLLKGGSEDYTNAVMRDELCTGMVNGRTNLYVLDCKPCILYLGDNYWGIYYLRERFSDDYVADHFGVSPESVDLLFSYGGVQSGSAKDYNALLAYCKKNDLSKEENYRYVTDRIDPVSLMDWYICRSYVGDKDYANIRYFRSDEYDNKWRWMYFDLDWSFWNKNDRPISDFIRNNDQNILMYNLLRNEEFKDRFLKRYAELMNSFLNEGFITAEIDRYVGILKTEIGQDRSRWGYTVESWEKSVDALYNYVKDGARTEHVLKDLKSYFKLTDEQMKDYFGTIPEK